MLQKYTLDLTHVVDLGELVLDVDGTFEERPVYIIDSQDQVWRSKTVWPVKVLWQHCGIDVATWEREYTMCANYPFLFNKEGMF